MKALTCTTLLILGLHAHGEPDARQAAPQAQELERPPIVRCGVGEVGEIEIRRPIGRVEINPEQQLKAFPAAEEGMKRYVVNLPKLEEEQAFKVEIIVGKTAMLDTANRHFIAGEIESEQIKGWGYTRYIVKKLGPIASTRRGRIGPSEKEEQFISLGGEPYLVGYNSRLPLVVYVPEDAEVKFRVWSAGERMHEMEEG